MAGSMETKLHEMEVQQHAHEREVTRSVAVPPVNAGSRIAELYQAFTDFTGGALGKELHIYGWKHDMTLFINVLYGLNTFRLKLLQKGCKFSGYFLYSGKFTENTA